MFLVLVHKFLLSDQANSGLTLFITPLRQSLSYPHVTTEMSVVEHILFTYRQNIPQQIPCSLKKRKLSEYLGFFLESVNPEFAPSHRIFPLYLRLALGRWPLLHTILLETLNNYIERNNGHTMKKELQLL